jgi:hypothetical protein
VAKYVLWINSARKTPVHEFRDVHAPISHLTFMHKNVCRAEFPSQFALRELGIGPELAQQPR